jgi:Secretion system C-terminal sorting domain/Fibronectin type III domain
MKRILLLLSFLTSFSANGFSQACPTPAAVVAVPRADGALVIWAPTSATLFEVQYRLGVDTATWISATVQSTGNMRDTASLQLRSLASCKAYTVRVRAKCSTTVNSDWRTSTFKTLGCPEPCATPRGLFATSRDSSASLNWAAGATGTTYVVEVKNTRDTSYRTINAATNSLTVSGLKPCSEYYFRVKSVCSTNSIGGYSEVARFKTLGCAAPCLTPREVKAISENPNKINFIWIGTSTLGYEVQHRIRDSAWSASTRVTTLNYRLENTRACTPYGFRVRAVCSQTAGALLYSEWSGTSTVTSAGCVVVARCEAPKRISYVPATTTTLVRWDSIAGAGVTYNVQLMGARDTAWRTITGIRTASTTLSGLTACSIYMVRVKTNCSATNSSNWGEPVRFQTIGCTPLCSKPKNFKAFVNDTTAILSWDRADLTSYKLTVASTDGSFATRTIAVTGFSFNLSGLVRCKTYKATLIASCTDGRSSEAATIAFTTVTRTCAGIGNDNCKVQDLGIYSANDSTVVQALATILASTYELQYRKASDSAWSAPISSARPSFVIRGLTRCSYYAVRVRAVCSTGAGDWKTKDFRAGNACFGNTDGGDIEYLVGNTGSLTSFAIYPNPGHDALALSYKLDQTATINVQLVNLQGQVVSQLNGGLQEAGNYNQTLENLGGLNEGLYMLVVRANGKVLATQKWTKQ